MKKVIFIGAGPGDPELITVKAQKVLKNATVILYTGSLVPEEVLSWAPETCQIFSSQDMNYEEIFSFYDKYITDHNIVRVHTGDPSIYSTIAKQIGYLNKKNIPYQVIPGVTASFGAAASLGIEYTIPGVSQTLIISKVEGKTPTPEKLETLLKCKNSSHVFYLSVLLINELVETALQLGYAEDTPCWVVEKATWPEENVVKGTLKTINALVKEHSIKKTALILLGNYLNQQETVESHLYREKATD
jgi:precorrin-4/cobalt-precorrin-4 C11-methyltransferase